MKIVKLALVLFTTLGSLYAQRIGDIANVIGENVVVGGVRRTAEIVLVDADDQESIEAKSKLYEMQDGKWIVNEEILQKK